MKATEARMQAIDSQYTFVMMEIKIAVAEGKSCTCVYEELGALFPETVDLLVKEGYDVKIFLSSIPLETVNLISWVNAEAERRGTVEWIDKTGEESA